MKGERVVHGDKELSEKLGRKDPCPCGSGKCFQEMLHAQRLISTAQNESITKDENLPTAVGNTSLSSSPV